MFNVVKTGKKGSLRFRVMSYLADYESDIYSLPTSINRGTQGNGEDLLNAKCAVGSVCRVAENSSVWILNNQNEWVEQGSGSGSSSGSGDSGTAEFATDEEVSEALKDAFG